MLDCTTCMHPYGPQSFCSSFEEEAAAVRAGKAAFPVAAACSPMQPS